MTEWQKIFTRVQRALPKNASFRERGEATRRAAAAYRAGKSGKSRQRNPSGPNWPLLAIGVGAAYLLVSGKLGGLTAPKK